MKAKTAIFATIATLTLGGAALAAQDAAKPAQTPPLFLKLDRDGNSALEKAEVLRPRAERFAKLDANGDGKLTAEEIDRHLKQRLQRRLMRMRYRLLARFDANGDGAISREEFTARALRRFARLDLNADGRVTPAELRAARKLRRHKLRRKAPGAARLHGKHRQAR